MKWHESDFASHLGQGIAVFLLCLGIGTCSMLTYNVKVEVVKPQEKPKVEQDDRK